MKQGTNMLTLYKYFILYKPYLVLCQFTPKKGKRTLKDIHDFPKDVYPVGRLDENSEGLLILTNDKDMNNKLLDPMHEHRRIYLVQVEGIVSDEALRKLQNGLSIKVKGERYKTKPAIAKFLINVPEIPERIPAIRYRKNIPTSWIELSLSEGKNHQVRKMTAAVGFPTLRLIRWKIEGLSIENTKAGEVFEIEKSTLYSLLRLK